MYSQDRLRLCGLMVHGTLITTESLPAMNSTGELPKFLWDPQERKTALMVGRILLPFQRRQMHRKLHGNSPNLLAEKDSPWICTCPEKFLPTNHWQNLKPSIPRMNSLKR